MSVSFNRMVRSSLHSGVEIGVCGCVGEKVLDAKIYATEKLNTGLQAFNGKWSHLGAAGRYLKLSSQLSETISQKVDGISGKVSQACQKSITEDKEQRAWHTLEKIAGKYERNAASVVYVAGKCATVLANLPIPSVPEMPSMSLQVEMRKTPKMRLPSDGFNSLEARDVPKAKVVATNDAVISYPSGSKIISKDKIDKYSVTLTAHGAEPTTAYKAKIYSLPKMHLGMVSSKVEHALGTLGDVAHQGMEKVIEIGINYGLDRAEEFVEDPIEEQVLAVEKKIKSINKDTSEVAGAVQTILHHKTASCLGRTKARFRKIKNQISRCLNYLFQGG